MTDQTAALRDRIRRAICEASGFDWDTDMLEPDEYGEAADTVIAVLPTIVLRADEQQPADRSDVRDRIAAATRQHYLVMTGEADADGNLPCSCEDWREPGPMGSDEDDWDSHLADAVVAALRAAGWGPLGEAASETHVVADDSDDPEHVDDCPGCTQESR
jgi:hypothetical protein